MSTIGQLELATQSVAHQQDAPDMSTITLSATTRQRDAFQTAMCMDEEQVRPTPEERRRRIRIGHEVFRLMMPFSTPYIAAIARTVAEDEGDFIGSGSFVVFLGQIYLVTAGHVATDAQAESQRGAAFSNGDGKPYQLVTSPFRIDANLDIAVAPVTLERPPVSTRLAYPASCVSPCAGRLDDLLFVHGFPCERSRFLRIGQGISSQPLAYGTGTTNAEWTDFDPEVHFAIGWEPCFSEYPDGTSATLPNPAGMSGSPVWNTRRREVGDTWQPADARLIGVIHRFDPTANCLIGTRIEHIHGLVARHVHENETRAAQ